MFKAAELSFYEKEYLDALNKYLLLDTVAPIDYSLKLKIGICYINSGKNIQEGINYLHQYKKQSGSNNLSPEYYLHIANGYHLNHEFDQSIANYQKYISLRKLPEDSLKLIQRQIEMCYNGKEFVSKPHNVSIENVGPAINTKYPDYVPVISADESVMIFTSRRSVNVNGGTARDGLPYEDIYVSKNINYRWAPAENIGSDINTPYHDASVSLSLDGRDLILYNSSEGALLTTHFDGNNWSKPVSLSDKINSKWSNELSACYSPDGMTIYFSSDREGGYGGRDIYKISKNKDGQWGEIINLGPTINTEYDEDGIFIHPDNRTFFFSSKGRNSMGGYDIFKSLLVDDKFALPENLGYPINTAGDDIYFVLSASGKRGYYSSARPGGYGEKDIYMINIHDATNIPLTMLRGMLLDGHTFQPIEAKLKVVDTETNREIKYVYDPDKKTGEYLMIFPPGKSYEIVIQAEGYLNYLVEINVPNQYKFYEIHQEIYLTHKDSIGDNVGEEIVIKNIFSDIKGSTQILPADYDRLDISNLVYDVILSDNKDNLHQLHDIFEGNIDPDYIYKKNVNDLVLDKENIESVYKQIAPIVKTNLKYLEEINPFKQELLYGANDTTRLIPLVLGRDTIFVAEVYNRLDSIYNTEDTANMSQTLKSLRLIKSKGEHYIDISGIVYKEGNIENIKVLLQDNKKNVLDSTYTNILGFYSFDSLSPDKIYQVEIVDNDFETKSFMRDNYQNLIKASNTNINPVRFDNVDEDEQIKVLDNRDFIMVQAGKGGTIVGKVMDKYNLPLGVKDLKVYLYKRLGVISDSILTDENGDFSFKDLEANQQYYVKVDTHSMGSNEYLNKLNEYVEDIFVEMVLINQDQKLEQMSSDKYKDESGYYRFVAIESDYDKKKINKYDINTETVVIQGRVVDENNPEMGIKNAKVYLYKKLGVISDSILTDENGDFAFKDLDANQQYYVKVDSHSKGAETYLNQLDEFVQDIFAEMAILNQKQEIEKISSDKEKDESGYYYFIEADKNNKVISGVRVIRGKVTDKNSPEVGIKDVKIYLYKKLGVITDSIETDENGDFAFKDLDDNQEYFIKVDDHSQGSDKYLNQLDKYVQNIFAEMVMLNQNQEVEKTSSNKEKDPQNYYHFIDARKSNDLKVENKVNINGIVLLEERIENATVYLLKSKGNIIDSVLTDILGYYSFNNLSGDDSYSIKTHLHQAKPGESYLSSAHHIIKNAINIKPDKISFKDLNPDINKLALLDPDIHQFKQVSGVRVVQGRIVDKDNPAVGIKNLKVYLYKKLGIIADSIETDENGDFSFKDLDADQQYYIKLDKHSQGSEAYLNQLDEFVQNIFAEMVLLNQDQEIEQTSSEQQINKSGYYYFIDVNKKAVDLSKYQMTSIYFGFDNYQIKEKEQQKLEALSKLLSGASNYELDIVGYADTIGNQQYNIWLSKERAKSVEAYMIKKVGQASIRIKGKGEEEPIIVNNKANMGLSRRVEVLIKGF